MEKDKSLAKACLLNVLNYLRTKALKRIQNLLSFYRETEYIYASIEKGNDLSRNVSFECL